MSGSVWANHDNLLTTVLYFIGKLCKLKGTNTTLYSSFVGLVHLKSYGRMDQQEIDIKATNTPFFCMGIGYTLRSKSLTWNIYADGYELTHYLRNIISFDRIYGFDRLQSRITWFFHWFWWWVGDAVFTSAGPLKATNVNTALTFISMISLYTNVKSMEKHVLSQ